jgi:hypothetical protein
VRRALIAVAMLAATGASLPPMPPGYAPMPLLSPKAAASVSGKTMVKAAPAAVVLPPLMRFFSVAWNSPPLPNCVTVVVASTDARKPTPWPIVAVLPCLATNQFTLTNPASPTFIHIYNLNTNNGLVSE